MQQPDEHQGGRDDQREPTEDEPVSPDSFGDPRVDRAVARTDNLGDRPVDEHVEVFDDVHQSLRRALDDPADGDPADDPAPADGA